MKLLELQPNEQLCNSTTEKHIFNIANCCPVSKNPGPGSRIIIMYIPGAHVLEVAALRAYINDYIGGRGAVRSMEGMIQNIAKDAAEILKVKVTVTAELNINPLQEMVLTCSHGKDPKPKNALINLYDFFRRLTSTSRRKAF